jgi:hypothetical protein
MTTPASSRWLRLGVPAGILLIAAATALAFYATRRAVSLVEDERELSAATAAHEPAAVREIVRRIDRIDDSTERRLRSAEALLAVGNRDDLEQLLKAVESSGSTNTAAVEILRARAAAAHEDWRSAVLHWNAALRPAAGLPLRDRSLVLDGLTHALMRCHEWTTAEARLVERLTLAESPATRLTHAKVQLRLRRWEGAAADFGRLKRDAANESDVKRLLAPWDRVQESIPKLTAADAAMAAAPSSFAARVDRAQVALHVGLWQNAAEDLVAAIEAWPSARIPRLLLATVLPSAESRAETARLAAQIDSLPLLAPSEALAAREERVEGRQEAWRALREVDGALLANCEVTHLPPVLGEQARLEAAAGFPELALEDARQVLRFSPTLLVAEQVEIAALLDLHRFVEAERAVTEAIARHRDQNNAVDAELGRLAALVFQAQGRHAAAVELFNAYLSVRRTPEVLRARAKSLRFTQRFAEADADLSAASVMEAAVAGRSQ